MSGTLHATFMLINEGDKPNVNGQGFSPLSELTSRI